MIQTSLDIPDGYTLNDNGSWKGSLPNSTGKVANGVLGITKRSTMAGGRFIRVNIAKPAFDSEELLFLISGHEFVHASHMLRNLDLKFSNQDFANLTEGGAWSWTMDAYHNNGWENLGRISNNYDIWGSYGQYTSAFLKYPLQTRNLFNFGTIRTIFKK